MDADQFDALTRRFVERPLSRRAVLTSAAGLLAALGLRHGAGAQVSQAQCGNKTCKKNPATCALGCVCCVYANGNSRCLAPGSCTGTVACPAGADACAGACVDPASYAADPNNCGDCGIVCGGGKVCAEGVCACPVGTRDCGGACAACCADSDCSDGTACTVDSCDGGICRYDPISCDDANACTIDSCDPVLGCQHQPITCDDGNPCTGDTCNPATGCVYTPLSGSACTTVSGAAGTCSSGTCIANPTTTTTPRPCVGCDSSQTACLANGSCADSCVTSLGCPFVCFCGFPSIEGPQYCVSGEGSCDSLAACSSTAQCPQGHVCQPVSCGDGGAAYRCVPLCTVT